MKKRMTLLMVVLFLSFFTVTEARAGMSFDLGVTPYSTMGSNDYRFGFLLGFNYATYQDKILVNILSAHVKSPALMDGGDVYDSPAAHVSSGILFSVFNPIYVGAKVGLFTYNETTVNESTGESTTTDHLYSYSSLVIRLQSQEKGFNFFMESEIGFVSTFSALNVGVNYNY